MGLSDAGAGQRFPVPAETAWTHLKVIAPTLGSVNQTDEFLKRLTLSTSMSMTGWGENLTVAIEPIDEGNCNVVVGASAKAGWAIGVVGHMAANSRNAKHIDAVISALSKSLQGPAPSPGDAPPASPPSPMGCMVTFALIAIGGALAACAMAGR